MLEELDEDTHLCIKCSLTIVGLENYVRHRKESCSKRARPPALPLNREISIDPSHSYREFEFSELDEHHAATSHINISSPPHQSQKSSAFKNEPNKSLSESFDYNDGLGADVFFSLLNLQSSSKSKQNLAATQHSHDTGPTTALAKASDVKIAEPKSAQINDAWIGTAATSGTEKLMKAVHAISGTKKPCFESPNSMYSYEYPHDHDSPEPPAYDDDEDDEIAEDDDYIAPPHTHTGGKWKPSERNTRSLATSTARWYERWDIPDERTTEELAADDFQPPPSHTKGKWVPGTKIIKLDYKHKERSERETTFSEQFWCNACNRKLKSRAVYERHLRSKLHTKRSQPEADLEEAAFPLPRFDDISVGESVAPSKGKRERNRERKPETITTAVSVKAPSPPKKRHRRCNYIRCDVCKSRLRRYLYGKHLISHYHYRRIAMAKQPKESYDAILKNIHQIVLQSPFQCQPCRFYANTESTFMRHWHSAEHIDQCDAPGIFWCTFCKFDCASNDEMGEHIVGADHQEVVMAINRSVPIIIRKRVSIECEKCSAQFLYNIELRRHSAICSESNPLGTASNRYQGKHHCSQCDLCFKSATAYQRHAANTHKMRIYLCGPCGLSFADATTAKRHRISVEHKVVAARARPKQKALKRKCRVCGETVNDLVLLKEHLREQHPEEYYA